MLLKYQLDWIEIVDSLFITKFLAFANFMYALYVVKIQMDVQICIVHFGMFSKIESLLHIYFTLNVLHTHFFLADIQFRPCNRMIWAI